jgi:acyl dehydratase
MTAELSPEGMYYEDFQKDQQIRSPGRTITESDVVRFAGLSGDYNQLHTDRKFAGKSPFGRRIAHGLLGPAVASGLAARLGLSEGTALALTKMAWKFRAPVYLGDTIAAVFTVVNKKLVNQDEGGFVKFKVQIYNQDDQLVQQGSWTLMVRTRAA